MSVSYISVITMTRFKMPWLRDKLVSDRSLVVMGKLVTMVHMDIKITVLV